MIDFIEYVVGELKSRRLSKSHALSLINQFSGRSNPAGAAVLHPLLHRNTSDLMQQGYTSTFTGSEFFLRDHRVHGKAVLPAVAYLEMIRVAMMNALPDRAQNTTLELRNVVWAQPVVVADRKDVSLALSVDVTASGGEEAVDFEIYSEAEPVGTSGGESESEVIHCQGQALLTEASAPPRYNIENLQAQMQRGSLEAAKIYPAIAGMGIDLGPAQRGIEVIHAGDRQQIVRIRLPEAVRDTQDAYVLHPSVMDSVLQAASALLVDLNRSADHPPIPFALESLRVFSGCQSQMFAWARYAAGSLPSDSVAKLDIDLCDQEGNVCVSMRGFSSRVLSTDIGGSQSSDEKVGCVLAVPQWQAAGAALQPAEAAVRPAQTHVVLCDIPGVRAQQLEAELGKQGDGICCSEWKIDQQSLAGRYTEVALACFDTLRSLLQGLKGRAHLQLVIAPSDRILAGLSGLLKTATHENPNLRGQIVVTTPAVSPCELTRQLREAQSRPHETIVKYEQGEPRVLRWQVVEQTAAEQSLRFDDAGVYLITGGLGGLGVLFAREILERTPDAKVILTGRSTANAATQATLEQFAAGGSPRVFYRQMELGDLDQVKAVLAGVVREFGRLDGILHSAGMISDAFILTKTRDAFRQVLEPKVTGTFNLDAASQDIELDFLALFSAGAAVHGNAGQADYAAANGFMDQFSAYRNQLVAAHVRRGTTVSINWPLWRDGGMVIEREHLKALQRTTGMQPMQAQTGLRAFHDCLQLRRDQILVVEGELEKIHQAFLVGPHSTAEAVEHETGAVPVAVDVASLADQTQSFLCRQFSKVLKLPAHKIDPSAPLQQYGIDSIVAMSLTNQLELTFGSLPKTLFFEYRSVRELTQHLIECYADTLTGLFAVDGNVGSIEHGAGKTRAVDTPAATAALIRSSRAKSRTARAKRRFRSEQEGSGGTASQVQADAPIAIVGLSGRYPESIDIDAYWRNLRDGKDCITEVPAHRWDWRQFYSEDRSKAGHHYSKWGGFIAGVDEFDPLFFGISPREARIMDPQERLFLQHAWMAIEDAGYTRATLQVPYARATAQALSLPGQVGVYVGVMYGEYNLSGSLAGIANRVSSVMNFHGPSMALDTMCSSSLTAIHLASQDLKQGRTDVAIAGGVNVSVHPSKYLMLSAGQFISSDGHCQSFGEGGDGYIPGEGVGVVVLKRLADAEREGDHIYAVIRGSALNHGGRTNGYTVPNPQAQASVIRQVLAESRVDSRHVSYIEAHGTGTKLGDPIEIAALSKAFEEPVREGSQDRARATCAIGSAKSNIGHCESAAGIAGLTKVLLQMQHRQLVPSLHSAQLNPHIDFDRTPFVVNQALRPWDQPVSAGKPVPRIAGISSFGAGGSNAHVVVQEYVPAVEAQQQPKGQVIIALSARTAQQLKHRARDLLDFIRAEEAAESIDLADMAYTLQVGREALDVRVGFVVDSLPQLAERLQTYVDGAEMQGADIEGMRQGQVKDHRESLSVFSEDPEFQETLDTWMARRKFGKLLDVWVKGLELNWRKLYATRPPRRISLPTYPFAKEKYWIETVGQVVPSATQLPSAVPTAAVPAADMPRPIQLNDMPTAEVARSTAADKPRSVPLVGLQEIEEFQAVAAAETMPAFQEVGKIQASDERLTLDAQESVAPAGEPAVTVSPVELQGQLSATLAQALYMEVTDVDVDKSFVDLGLDSIVGVEWVKVINKQYGLALAATRVYDYPNIKELASFVAKELAKLPAAAQPPVTKRAEPEKPAASSVEKPATEPRPSVVAEPSTPPASVQAAPSAAQPVEQAPRLDAPAAGRETTPSGKIAIVGMSGKYPQAKDLRQYWENLAAGSNAVVEIPASRWDVNQYFDEDPTQPGKVYCKWLGMLDDVDCFDPLFFQISPAEAQAMDPQHRLFMQEAYRAFEDAGYSNTALSNAKCGVYLGIMSNEYSLLLAKDSSIHAAATGTSYAIGAARIAYHLNLKGPAIPIDTACSSSLVAMHLACQALLNREIDMALAGGVTLYLTPDSYLAMCQLGMLSRDGQCKTFDDAADGFVPGEGVGAVVLKRLEDAEADGDFIHGLILGSAINQDGKTNGITAPSVSSQIELERDLYAKHRIEPETISYVETHGTGTKLGDPIELEALATVFGEKTAKRNYCALGSVKTNIGHTSGAAGVAGVQKVLLSMRHHTLAPTLNLTTANTLFDFQNSPFYICRERQAWHASPGSPLRASVSSFGFSGTNAHLVLEEYVPRMTRSQPLPVGGDVAVVLSARTATQLEQKAQDLLDFLLLQPVAQIDLAALAYTLQVGRETFKERLGVVAGSAAELIQRLRAYLGGAKHVEHVYRGQVGRDKDALAVFTADPDLQATTGKWLELRRFGSLLDLWAKGLDVDWRRLYVGRERPRRMGLPTYPFAKERYWPTVQAITPPTAVPAITTAVAASTATKQGLIYVPSWREAPLQRTRETVHLPGATLLVATLDELLPALKKQLPLDAKLMRVRLQAGALFTEEAPDVFCIDAEREEQFVQLVETLKRRNALPAQVLHHYSPATGEGAVTAQLANGAFYPMFNLCKALLAGKHHGPVRVVSVHAGHAGIAAAQNAALAGFFKTLALESPKYQGKAVAIRGGSHTAAQIAQLMIEELREPGWHAAGIDYRQVRKESADHVRRVEVLAANEQVGGSAELPLKQHGVYLVTGGMGGLGFIFCEYLVESFAARLVLIGRSSLNPEQLGKLRRLQARQPEVAYVQADVADLEDVARIVQETKARFGVVNGVIHAAGVNKDAFIVKKTREQIDAVLRAKILGTTTLDETTRAEQLDLFVMFSSVASTWGNAGQSDYAYGNSFMAAFAEYRDELRLRGDRYGRTLSIDWPFWIEGGMSLSPGEVERAESHMGLSPLPTRKGIELWEQALRSDLSRAVALYGDATRIGARPIEAVAHGADQPATFDPTQLLTQARQYLQSLIGREIKLHAEQVDAQERFETFGIDSVVVGRLNATLAHDFGALPKTLFYEYETVEALAEYFVKEAPAALRKLFQPDRGEPSTPVDLVAAGNAPAQRPTHEPALQDAQLQTNPAEPEKIAIIGVHGYYPGCENLDDYWRHLRAGDDLVGPVPVDRWDAEALYDGDPAKAAEGKIYCKSGAFLDDVDKFDAPFFNIAAEEAKVIDPQERLFLSSVWSALEDAGYTREDLKKRHPKARSADVGVFVGVTTNSYQLLAAEEWGRGNVAAASALPWSIANRVSYFFDFQGPSMPVDTACSSSLVAIHLACESLQKGECRLAIAGGVNLYLHPSKYHSLCQRGMLATGGKCRSYGDGDDGFIPGEAVGALVLKPLSEALKDGDHVYAVVAGSAHDHCGRSNGYSAPNPNSQASVIGRVLAKAGIHPESIGYIEGHGTGTQLGDSLEIAALTQAFRKHTDKRRFCPVGSVKANLGHSESAAGIAGVTKILLQMKHGQLAPSIHSQQVNPNIDFEASPCYLQHGLTPWPSATAHPRRALINSFGAGGVNASLVLEEYVEPVDTRNAPSGPHLVVLSATTDERLREYARRLLAHVDVASDIDLAALCFTLQVGREAMPERLALVVANIAELRHKLGEWLSDPAGNIHAASVHRGTALREHGKTQAKTEAVNALLAARDLQALAQAWISGERIEWQRCHANPPRRVSLPSYPFAKQRYWVSQTVPRKLQPDLVEDARLHPLVSHNCSTLKEVSFSSVLSAGEFYARDHKVNEQMIFPGAGFLEIARAAGAIAGPSAVTRIKDVVWVQPLVFSAESQLVQTVLQPEDGQAQFTITSYGEDHERVVHAEGIVQFCEGGAEPAMSETYLPIEALKAQCLRQVLGDLHYDTVEKSGISYGPTFRAIDELYVGEGFALSRLRLADELMADFDEYVLHPSIVDGALQTVSGLLGEVETSVPHLPFAIDEIQILRCTAPSCYVHVEASGAESQANAEVRKFNVQITNEHGLVLVTLRNFCVRAFKFTAASVALNA